MNIALEQRNATVLLTLTGMLDTLNSDKFMEAIANLPENGKNFELDMADVPYMSSAGLRALLHLLEVAKQRQGTLRIVQSSDFVREVLSTVGFDALMEIA